MINVFAPALLIFSAIAELHAECVFSLNEHVPKTALLMDKSQAPQIFYPNQSNKIKVPTGSRLKLTCGDKYFKKKFKKTSKTKEIVARCNSNDVVSIQGERLHFRELECEDFPSSSVKKNASRRCHQNNTSIDIGFKITNNFMNSIQVCFDELQQESIYSLYNSSMLSTGHQSGVGRPQFVSDGLYSFPVDKVYTSRYQHDWFTKLLKSREKADEYIKHDGQHFLSRGHLTPKADMVYGVEQSATFHYINVAPQWQTFNGGNWERVESSTRDQLKKKDKR